MNFNTLQRQVKERFDKLAKGSLFHVAVDRDKVFELYLAGFAEDERQEHNCNSCKSFLRQYAGVVAIKNNQMLTLWDNLKVDAEYAQAIQNVKEYIHSLPITDVFLSETATCGTKASIPTADGLVWTHFYFVAPASCVKPNGVLPRLRGQSREAKEMLQRALAELTLDATRTVLELIGQNSLYRGSEFAGLLQSFLKLQEAYANVPEAQRNNYCWATSGDVGSVTRIRNSAIGTLLVDLSNGVELDAAVSAYERVVAPSNYKRPSALVTPKMVEQAKDKLAELGLLSSLDRRYATEADLNINDILFSHQPARVTDVFASVTKDMPVNPKTFSKVEEITIDDFLTNVVPTAKTIEVLVENRHQSNFVSLMTAVDQSAPHLFKWPNHFAWNYTGNLADSMKERVKAAGGKVDGVLRFSIQWNEDGKNSIDFDAHAFEPNKNEIFFRNCKKPSFSRMTGQLDVDIISPGLKVAVENITWSHQASMEYGVYRFHVHNYSDHTSKGGFKAEIEFDGHTHEFEYGKNLRGGENVYVAEVNYTPQGFSIKPLLDSTSSVNSIEKWGLKTATFHKVTKLMLSPNHWGGSVGNKHFLFFLEGCTPEESSPRAFFNEYLKQELDPYRKVLEIVGGKIEVAPSPDALAGLGFSETQRNSLIVRVTGSFARTVKVNF